jgi:succinyl-diaminopimelate desuccinylase
MKQLLKKLVDAQSTVEKGELAAAKVIGEEFAKSGIASVIDRWEQTRANVTATIKSSGEKKGILFACHLDVVGPGERKWTHSPFNAVESGGRIYGRGAADMKGGIAAIVCAIKDIVDSGVKLKGDIVFAATAGEETDSCGTKRFVRGFGKGEGKLAGVVIPEPTDFDVITAHRGLLWLEIVTAGKSAHGSTPQLGINAISMMKMLLDELEHYKIKARPLRGRPHKLLGNCSMSVNTISGGKAINVVPDKCRIEIDIRTLPGQSRKDIIEDLRKVFAKLRRKNPKFKADISIVRSVDAFQTDCDCEFVRSFCAAAGVRKTKAVGFTTDGPDFARFGAPVVVFGPGKPELCHKSDEYIEIADVQRAAEYYKEVILKLLA